jgi:SHS2 domain-containing protein
VSANEKNDTKGYELFDHTADIGVKAYGANLPSIFENTANGMLAVIFHNSLPDISVKGEYRIKLQASDLEELLKRWLDELLYIFSTEHIIFSKYQISIDPEKFTLDALIGGEIVSEERLLKTCEIKAVTYHMLKIEKTKHWEAQVLFDI